MRHICYCTVVMHPSFEKSCITWLLTLWRVISNMTEEVGMVIFINVNMTAVSH